MKKEAVYMQRLGRAHTRRFGQYFTPPLIAEFMCSWACADASTMLDPAVGNGVFLQAAHDLFPGCRLRGFEVDGKILSFFGSPPFAGITHGDYLQLDWDTKYDAIVCNPPYNRFQAVGNRDELLELIYQKTGVRYSGYTNLYALFLLKSLCQLSPKGRLAYIIPTEFLNSQYGTAIKEKLLRERLIRAIINFQNDGELFANADTTCCILLLDRSPKDEVMFFNLSSMEELRSLRLTKNSPRMLSVSYREIKAADKWRSYLHLEAQEEYLHLTQVDSFCKISRGAATGANSFFCLSRSKIQKLGLADDAVSRCICRSADVKRAVFRQQDFEALAREDKTVYVLDVKGQPDAALQKYLAAGQAKKLPQKYLLSCRRPWYSMEQRPAAPIWVSSAYRGRIKFVRNLAEAGTLTTFHAVYIKEPYRKYTDIIFCYFLTPIAQHIIRKNRRELGSGLEKFQPGDLKNAKMLDLTCLSDADCRRIMAVYEQLREDVRTEQIQQLNEIFLPYLLNT